MFTGKFNWGVNDKKKGGVQAKHPENHTLRGDPFPAGHGNNIQSGRSENVKCDATVRQYRSRTSVGELRFWLAMLPYMKRRSFRTVRWHEMCRMP